MLTRTKTYRDWKAHKVLCSRGWMPMLENTMQESDIIDEIVGNKPVPF